MAKITIDVPDSLLSQLRTDVRNSIMTNRDEDGNLIVPFEYQELLFQIYGKLLAVDPAIKRKKKP